MKMSIAQLINALLRLNIISGISYSGNKGVQKNNRLIKIICRLNSNWLYCIHILLIISVSKATGS